MAKQLRADQMRGSAQYNFVRGRQLEGTYPGVPGTGYSVTTGARVMRGYGMVSEGEWPFDTSVWPPIEPPGLDRIAKQFRVWSYQRIRSVRECKVAVDLRLEPNSAFKIDLDQWSDARNGVIEMPNDDQSVLGAHAVPIVAYDDSRQQLIFRNSWGEGWGNRGYGRMPYDFFSRYLLEAWAVPPQGGHERYLTRPRSNSKSGSSKSKSKSRSSNSKSNSGKDFLKWRVSEIMEGGTLYGVERYDPASNENWGWAFAVIRDGFFDVEELFVRPEWRNRGYGRGLTEQAVHRAEQLGLPVRMWVPHVDGNNDTTLRTFSRIAHRLGLRLHDSPLQWAAFVATDRTSGSS